MKVGVVELLLIYMLISKKNENKNQNILLG